jgi:4-hydroxy-3-polyprenylbenzoate decarboxylase/2,5-furandicarboxylate decarboxylase 1
MAYQKLRAFLAVLKQSGELVDVSRPIALKYDVAKALAKSNSVEGPALMFKETGTAFHWSQAWQGRWYGEAERFGGLERLITRPCRLLDRQVGALDNDAGAVIMSALSSLQ